MPMQDKKIDIHIDLHRHGFWTKSGLISVLPTINQFIVYQNIIIFSYVYKKRKGCHHDNQSSLLTLNLIP